MIEVTEEMRAAGRALDLGLCPRCGKPLEVKGGSADNEDGDLAWVCPCGFPDSATDEA